MSERKRHEWGDAVKLPQWNNKQWCFWICSNCKLIRAVPKKGSDAEFEYGNKYRYFDNDKFEDHNKMPCADRIMKDVLQ